MLIIADENIPQVKEAFSAFGDVKLLAGRSITKGDLKDADVLLVRSVTKVNKDLLEGTNIKFVATATIGTDHIDKDYLKEKNIAFADASGCNAYSVAEYVICAVTSIFYKLGKKFSESSIGIIGYGNIGKKVAKFTRALGFKVLINDPPLQREGYPEEFCSLDETLLCDVVTFHVPLNKSGIDKTFHLLDESNIGLIKKGAILINSSRGPVVDNQVLKRRLVEKKDLITILDVWENEPKIDTQLLDLVNIGTPHIAGYSYEGKINSTVFIYNKFCDYMNVKPSWQPVVNEVENSLITIDINESIEKMLNEVCKKIYDIEEDSHLLKQAKNYNPDDFGIYFDSLRKHYRIRREFNNYTIKLNEENDVIKKIFEALRFRIL
ncbi:MAG: 4-phosphoerythronate dehydrogenase [Melioribacter sp.]|uniref:4-phosphoerythronate dehydrogenase n=1 Tax=Rosettibacter primus TaxID=3111523 RepID=UPI00247C26E9|nr:4-phosphoerythronate dehydrogenase [Melioribacter sp.]